MAKSIAPTGLSVSRNGSQYTLSWKLGDSDYKDGEKLWWQVNGGAASAPINLGKNNPTSYVITPGPVWQVGFAVCGNRSTYTKNKKRVKPGWSDWASLSYLSDKPAFPTLEYRRDSANSGTFSCL